MTIREIDYDIRKLNSIILRATLIIILIYIFFSDKNCNENKFYWIAMVLYIALLFVNTFNKFVDYKGFCRSIMDLTIVGIFLYGKDLSLVNNFLPITILLFNITNHSNKKSNLHFFIPLLHVTILIIDKFNFILTHHAIPCFLYIFLIITSIRQFIMNLNEEIISTVAEIFINRISDNNIYKILREVKNKLNSTKLGITLKIEEIFLFKIINGSPILVRGSKFLKNGRFTTKIKNEKNYVDAFKNSETYREHDIIIEDLEYKVGYWLKITIKDKSYLILLCFNGDSFLFRNNVLPKIKPVFDYVIRIYYIIESLIELRKQTSEVVKEKLTHVLDAQNALHFVRNKLTPITTSINLIDRYFKEKESLDETKRKHIEARLTDNKNLQNLKIILDRADILIGGVDSLIKQREVIVSFKQVIDELREHWIYEFGNFYDVQVVENLTGVKISYNQALFGFIFTDLITNINKYCLYGNKEVIVNRGKDFVTMTFTNEIDNYEKNKIVLIDIETEYNLENNNEIYARKTHGLNFIRGLLRKKKIENRLFIDKEKKTFNFEIKFLIIYENSSV